MANREVILVTGSSGFIGGWIAETLYLDRSAVVRAGIRSWSSAARLGRFPLDIVHCDVMDKQSILRAMQDVDRVIHCASGSEETIVEGTRNMLEVALQKNVKRFVYISSTEVYGNRDGRIDETTLLKHTGNPYADAKIAAETLCWESLAKGLPVTIIRPSIVYGPFSKDWTIGFAQKLQSGNWGILKGVGEGICNLVYVADVVDGILLAARDDLAVGEAFNLVGPESITWNNYFQRFNAALALPALREVQPSNTRLRSVIMSPLRNVGKFILNHFRASIRNVSQQHRNARLLMQFVDRMMKTTPRATELALFNREAIYLNHKAQELLHYQPSISIQRGLELSAGWLRMVGLADRSRGDPG